VDNFSQLTAEKQFHFASRLHLWSGDERAGDLLKELRPYFTADESPQKAVQALLQQAQDFPIHGSKNAGELRAPYFQQYPQLKPCVTILFRVLFLRAIYGIDARDIFSTVFQREDVESMAQNLLADEPALRILSTHAINFLYLYARIIETAETTFDPQDFLVLKKAYNLSDPIHLQLFIYLFTHCIIGESIFYTRALPSAYLPTYQQMFNELETVIADNFERVNLDNKFEFLVCGQLMGQTSRLQSKIFDEASDSISDEGTFLIDRHNTNPQTNNVDLDKSEHRNVLFIMANRPFTPRANLSNF
jgi:hypothetical protein